VYVESGESMEDVDIESKMTTYATEFLKSYTDTIYNNFPGALERISEFGMEAKYFPLHQRVLGEDTAIAVLFTSSDFYMFFLADPDCIVARLKKRTEIRHSAAAGRSIPRLTSASRK
jgi:hypothetical protein